ncbi:MAG: subtilisin family serine protease, partial [Flavobacteriales bacterium]
AADFQIFRAAARQAGAQVIDLQPRFGDVVRVVGTPESLRALSVDPAVVVMDVVPPAPSAWAPVADPDAPVIGTLNDASRDTSNADDVSPGGELGLELTGSDVVLGIIDGGRIRTSHADFGGRVEYLDGDTDFDSHATHVAGTMVGAGGARADARGFAPEARLLGWSFNRDNIALMSEASVRFVASNHSYGFDIGWDRNGRWVGDEGFGQYGLESRRSDEVILQTDAIWVKAAGNDRGQGAGSATAERPADCSEDRDCIGSDGAAKNMILVAASADLTMDPAPAGAATPTSFSSRGPMDDGRVKPDIAANGDSLLSTGTGSDSDYVRLSGTSMAAPSVTGGIGLIAQHMRDVLGREPGAAEMRGLLIHTAIRNTDDGAPNHSLGWGVMDVRAAVEHVTASATEGRTLFGIYDGSPQSFTVSSASGEETALTLVWLDPAGAVNTGASNNTTPALVNDLDLRASRGGTTFWPWRFDVSGAAVVARNDEANRVDNVERIVIPRGLGPVSVTLTHEDSVRDQPYVLLSSQPIEAAQEQATLGGIRVLRLRVANDEAPVTLPLPISLTSGATIAYDVDSDGAPFWLSLDRSSGSLPSQVPNITIDARGLSTTIHYGELRVVSDNGTHRFTVILDVRGLEFPEANAGNDFSIVSAVRMELTGTATDPLGEPLTVEWTQTAGPAVMLDDADTLTPAFNAPVVSEITVLRFELVASNGSLDSAPSAIDVSVVPTEGRDEPGNNRCETAPRVSLPFSQNAELTRADVDYVRISLFAGETVTASTFRRGESVDTTIGLLRQDGTLLASDDDGGADLYSALDVRVDDDGEYCVAVGGFPDLTFNGAESDNTGTYGLTISVDRPNVAPIADAGPNVTEDAGARVELDGTASIDPDGFTLRYDWTQTSGPGVELSGADGPRPRFLTPLAVSEPTELSFTLRVEDLPGASDEANVTVSLRPGLATGPVADAGPDRIVASGVVMSLEGRSQDDESVTLSWRDPSGALRSETGTVRFQAPDTDVETTLTWTFSASTGVSTDEDTVNVLVLPTVGADEPQNNRCATAPLIGRSPLIPIDETLSAALEPRHDVDFYTFEVLEGTTYDLEVVPNGPVINPTLGVFGREESEWQTIATNDDDGGSPYSRIQGTAVLDGFLCVGVSHYRDLLFDGGAADGDGPYGLAIRVVPPAGANTAPVAIAGDDRPAEAGALEFLDGSASFDPEAQPVDFRWRQVSGPISVDVFDALEPIAQVIVPNDLARETEFSFELSVFDGAFTDTDVVTLLVAPNNPPTVEPIARIEVELGETVTFDVIAADPDGDPIRFIAEELPSTATFDDVTGHFEWIADEAGFFTPRIEALDPSGAFAEVFVTVISVDRETENRAPVVVPLEDRLVEAEDSPVDVLLSIDASDPDGDTLSFFWETDNGTFLGAAASVTPALAFGTYDVSVFVSDGQSTTSSSMVLTVRSANEEPPIADAGPQQRVPAILPDDVPPLLTLDGRASQDPVNRGALRYEWLQTAGPDLELFGRTTSVANFEQPTGEGALRFELTVYATQDEREVPSAVSETTIELTTEVTNRRPVAAIEGSAEATVGEATAYSALASTDEDGDALSYFWTLGDGEGELLGERSSTIEATFVATESRTWSLTLIVSDGEALSEPVTRVIRSAGTSENKAPDARAQLTGVPRVGATVTLDATGSTDPEDDALLFEWSQTSGATQSLTDANGALAQVEISGPAGETVTFEVLVDDGTAFDRQSVSFQVLGGSFDADAGPDSGGNGGSDADGSDAGGDSPPSGNSGGGCTASGVGAGMYWLIGAACLRRRRRRL